MTIVICPGIHDPRLTQSFLQQLQATRVAYHSCNPPQFDLNLDQLKNLLVLPAQRLPVYSAFHILEFLRQYCSIASPLVMICFSAGVVGGIGAARSWRQFGGIIKAFIALDGWGVPLYDDFPIHRLSHDRFTHWSSRLLGEGADSFWADPPVEHLELWRSPQTAQGWWQQKSQLQQTTAATFLNLLLEHYREQSSNL